MITKLDSQDKYVIIMNKAFRYEDNRVEFYANDDHNQRILTNPKILEDQKVNSDNTFKSLRNPYREAYLILKGELLHLNGIVDALSGMELIVQMDLNTKNKKRSNQIKLENLTTGKITVKSIF